MATAIEEGNKKRSWVRWIFPIIVIFLAIGGTIQQLGLSADGAVSDIVEKLSGGRVDETRNVSTMPTAKSTGGTVPMPTEDDRLYLKDNEVMEIKYTKRVVFHCSGPLKMDVRKEDTGEWVHYGDCANSNPQGRPQGLFDRVRITANNGPVSVYTTDYK